MDDFNYEARDKRGDWFPRQIRRNLLGYVVPSARIADWLRSPRGYGWVVRVAPGRYRPGSIPKSTLRRMRRIAAMSHFRQSDAA